MTMTGTYGEKWAAPCENVSSTLRAYAETEGLDKPEHPRSLIRTFTVLLQNHWHHENMPI